jgi:hypothetical protein
LLAQERWSLKPLGLAKIKGIGKKGEMKLFDVFQIVLF